MGRFTTDDIVCAVTIALLLTGMLAFLAVGLQHIWMFPLGWMLGITFGRAATLADRAKKGPRA